MHARYSDLKKLVPSLTATPEQVGEAFTATGFMMDSFEEVTDPETGKPDWILGLEVRQNRPDCQNVIGVAREIAAYYRLPLVLPEPAAIPSGLAPLPVSIEAPQVTRVEVLRFDGVKNGPSPAWLAAFLTAYGMEPINLLVDISNYVMLHTGYPSHVIDAAKMQGTLSWSTEPRSAKAATLAGTEIDLAATKPLVIQDEREVISVSAIVGTRYAEVGEDATAVVIEMAVYDPSSIRSDSRATETSTEASRRLEKPLATSGVDAAMALLADLVLTHAGGTVTQSFSFGRADVPLPSLLMPLDAPSSFAGIDIPHEEAEAILAALDFAPVREGEALRVTVPAYRSDVTYPEDLVEEVVRMNGYYKIPSDELPALVVTAPVSMPVIDLSGQFRDTLAGLGLDETLSSPMVAEEDNRMSYAGPDAMVLAQNAVNDEYPAMRQTLASGLLGQVRTYIKQGVEDASIFEVGVVFAKTAGGYAEHEACAALLSGTRGIVQQTQDALETLLRRAGIRSVTYAPMASAPEIANPHAAWTVSAEGTEVGVLYQVALPKGFKVRRDAAFGFFEVNTVLLAGIVATLSDDKAVAEIESKLVTLDANVEMRPETFARRLPEIQASLGDSAFEVRVIDTYQKGDNTQYTLRVAYRGLDDQAAKALHKETFGE